MDEETKRQDGAGCPHARGGEPPTRAQVRRRYERCPHARGGEPDEADGVKLAPIRCPHARGGEPEHARRGAITNAVVPTPVGVNRATPSAAPSPAPLSPRPWG